MSSRSRRELVVLAFGAAGDGVWCGALAAVLTGGPGLPHAAFATVVVYAAAVLALRRGCDVRPGRAARGSAVALATAAAAGLFVAGRSWNAADPVRSVVIDVAYAALLVVVGAGLGSAARSPNAATRHAVRAFVLVSVVVVGATAGGSPPPWATWAFAATLVASGLFVAAARCESLAALTPPSDRSPAWPWLLAVFGVTLLVVALGLALTQVLEIDLIARALAIVGGVVRYALAWAGYAVGYAGAALIRVFGWVAAQVGVHQIEPFEPPDSPGLPRDLRSPQPEGGGGRGLPRAVVVTALSVVTVAVSLAVVAFALRRVQRLAPEQVEEERESVTSLRTVVADGADRLAGRLRRLVTRTPPPKTPAESVRRRYAELERRLGRAGYERSPGTTVRAFLLEVCAVEEGREGGRPDAAREAATAIAGIYECARYSAEPVEGDTATVFDRLVSDLGATVTG